MSARLSTPASFMTIRALILAWVMALASGALAQTSRSTTWHLPLDAEAQTVRQACDSAEVLVPSIQPMATWNRPATLTPRTQGFQGIEILGDARQVFGDFRAPSTAVGLKGEGTVGTRGHVHVAATRWRLPMRSATDFGETPFQRDIQDHGAMDGLGAASMLDATMASVDRIEGALSWALSPSVAFRVGQESHHWGRGVRSLFLDRHMAPALGARLWVDAGLVQYSQILLRTRHAVRDSTSTGWLAAQWVEVELGRGWSGALFGAVKWRANDVGFENRLEPHYLVPMAAFRPREYSIGSADNALIGGQLSHRTRFKRGQLFHAYGQLLMDELLVSKLREGNGWWGNKWGALVGATSTSRTGKFGWLIEGAVVRPWTYTHNTLPLSYTHMHQPLGHSAGSNFVEGRFRIRTVVRDTYTVRFSYLRRLQGRSEGPAESNLTYAAGEMPWTSFSERAGEDGHRVLQGVFSDLARVELDVSMPLGERYEISGIEAFVRVWTRFEEQDSPGAWEDPWNAGRLEIGVRQSRVMDERDW